MIVEKKIGSNNYNSSPMGIISKYKMLLGIHENVLQKLPSPLNQGILTLRKRCSFPYVIQ